MSGDPRGRSSGQADLFRQMETPKERTHAPFQVSSATSESAAKRISESPAFAGNKLACLKAIAKHSGNITRKQIAEMHFAGKQNYVTGPVAQLIEEGLVMEEPAYDRNGFIMRRSDHSIVPRKIDHSAVLKLTNKGHAATAGAA